jgi:hypothetical protein
MEQSLQMSATALMDTIGKINFAGLTAQVLLIRLKRTLIRLRANVFTVLVGMEYRKLVW